MTEAVQNLHNKNTGMSRKSRPMDDTVDHADSSQQLIKGIEHVLSLVGPVKEEISQLHQHIANHEDTAHLRSQLDEVKRENTKLQQCITETNGTSDTDNSKLLDELQQAKEQIKGFGDSLKKREDELAEKHKEEINAYKDVNLKTEELLQAALKEVEEKKSMQERLKLAAKKKMEEQKEESSRLYNDIKTLKDEKRKLEEDLSDTKSRLSKLMGDKLSDNNPDIADLSDKNRPTKIGEKYQELYDNQWTDAYEVAEKYFKDKEERTRIRLLTKLLMDVYELCKKEFAAQDNELMQALQRTGKPNSGLPNAIKKQVKDIKRHTATDGIENITKKFVQNADKTTQLGNFIDKAREFVHECVSVCWLMVHQDPPLAFDSSIKIGKQFDSNKYKAYTVTGTVIDYVVWPALLLHQDGSVLTKGVVQCVKPFKGSQSVKSRSRQISSMGIPTGSVRLTGKEAPVNPSEWLKDVKASGNKSGRSANSNVETITSQTSDLKVENTRTTHNVNQETMNKTNSSKPTADDKRSDQTNERQQQNETFTQQDRSVHQRNKTANMQQQQAYSQREQSAQQFHSEANVQSTNNQSADIPQQQPQIKSTVPTHYNNFKQNQSTEGYSQTNTTQQVGHAQWSNVQQNQPSTFQQPQTSFNNRMGNQQQFTYHGSVPTQQEYAYFEYNMPFYHADIVRQWMGPESYDRCKRYYDWLLSIQSMR